MQVNNEYPFDPPTLVRSINVREYKAVEDVSSKDSSAGPILVCKKGGYAFYIEWKGDVETGKWHHSTVKDPVKDSSVKEER